MSSHYNESTDRPQRWVAVDVSGGDQSFSSPLRGLYVGGTGNIVMTCGGAQGTWHSVAAGQPIAFPDITIIHQSGTTATNIKGLA